MISKVCVTYQLDDLDAAVAELKAGLAQGAPLASGAVGLLMCYSDMDVAAFAAAASAALPFDVIGCTCIASMDGKRGFHEIAACLLVLSAEDCTFGVGVSGPVAPGAVAAQVEAAYAAATKDMAGAPGLVIAIPPYNLGIMLDDFTNAFNRVAKGVPVVGGLPSFNATGDVNATLHGGMAYPDRLVMLAIAGNIRPVFSVQNVTASAVERKRRVTEARGNTVYRVGPQTFVEYMLDIGFPMDSLTGNNDTITYVSNPLLLEHVKLDDGEDFSFVRTLHKIDLDEGSGTAIGEIPEGATLSICALQKADIERAAAIGMRDLRGKMAAVAAEGYQFSTVLAISCIGRYLLMLPNGETETNSLLAELPEGITMAGFYGYGEIGPLPMDAKAVRTFAHNESLVLCAL